VRITIRLEDGECLATDDGGETRNLTVRASELKRWWMEAPTLEGSSAAVLADLAHARAAAPRSNSGRAATEPAPHGERTPLGPLQLDDSNALAEVLRERRSTRTFGPLTVSALASVLMRAGRVAAWTEAEDGYQASHRPAPSAGARHPFDIHVVSGRGVQGLEPGAYLFEPVAGALLAQEVHGSRSGILLSRVAERLASPSAPPAALFLVARLQRTLGRYPSGMSLIWRDAGVLLQTLHLCACDLGLNSCILGTCGWLESGPSLVDMGALAIGGPRRSR
jgi:SagB-type dehydrogenase family enzyme